MEIAAVMADSSLSEKERQQKIMEIEARARQMEQQLQNLVQRMGSDQRMLGLSMQERQKLMQGLLRRARMAIEQQSALDAIGSVL